MQVFGPLVSSGFRISAEELHAAISLSFPPVWKSVFLFAGDIFFENFGLSHLLWKFLAFCTWVRPSRGSPSDTVVRPTLVIPIKFWLTWISTLWSQIWKKSPSKNIARNFGRKLAGPLHVSQIAHCMAVHGKNHPQDRMPKKKRSRLFRKRDTWNPLRLRGSDAYTINRFPGKILSPT